MTLSIFGFYFVGSLLREAGWPRKQGLFKGEGYDTLIADAAIDQMVNWAASLGAGRPNLALQIIAEIFRDRSWDNDDAPEIEMFVNGARASWDGTPDASPREVVQPIQLRKAFGASISTKDFQDSRLQVALEQNVLEALLWGLANPDRFETWYAGAAQHHESSLRFKRSIGLDVGALPALEDFFRLSEEIVRNYEREVGPLPLVPDRLLSDARRIRVMVDD